MPNKVIKSEELFDNPNTLKHYTNFYSLISNLSSKAIHLGDPDKWEDKNDSAAVKAFANGRTVRVLCLTTEEETLHHWNTYAKDIMGCRIDFNTKIFFETLKNIPEIMHGKMEYIKRDFDFSSCKQAEYPFLKRSPYKCDGEYRVVWAGKGTAPVIPIEGIIKRITLSPHIQDYAVEPVKKLLKSYGIGEVCKSTILENKEFINKIGKRKK